MRRTASTNAIAGETTSSSNIDGNLNGGANNNRLDNLKPIYYLSLISGTYPLKEILHTAAEGKITTSKDDQYENEQQPKRSIVKISWLGVACSTVWFAVLIVLDVHPFRMPQSHTDSVNETSTVFTLLPGNQWISEMTVVSALSKTLKIILLGVQLLRLPGIRNIISELASVDEQMKGSFLIDGSDQYNRMTDKEHNVSLFAILTSVLTLISTSFYMERNTSNAIQSILICFNDSTNLIIFSVNLQLYTFCRVLSDRFKAINCKLEDTIIEKTNSTTETSFPQLIVENLRVKNIDNTGGDGMRAVQLKNAFRSYWKLVDILDTMVIAYRMQILLGLCWSFLRILIDVYMIAYLVSKGGTVSWMEALNVRPLAIIVQLIYLSAAGSSVTKEARNIATILANIETNSSLGKATQLQVTVFLERLKYTRICLPIYCILQLDLSLIISFVEGVSSYTIIMLQYNWLDK